MRITTVSLLVILFVSHALTLLPNNPKAAAQDFSPVVAKARSAIVLVLFEQSDGTVGSGTGFAISGTPVVVTAGHVASDVKEMVVRYADGSMPAAKPVFVWREKDVALVRPTNAQSIGLSGRSTPPRVGEPVIVVGYPLTDKLGVSQISVTQGIVSAVRDDVIQLNVSVNPGNSGGPVLDATGAVIGVVTGRLPDTGFAFASAWINVRSALDAFSKDSYPVAVSLGDPDKYVTGWIEQGTLLVQIDTLASFLGGIVFWDGQTKTLTLAVAGKRLRFVENSRYMDVDGQQVVLPLPVRDRKIPLRPVVSVLGGSLEVDLVKFAARVHLAGVEAAAQPTPPATPPTTPSPATPPQAAPAPPPARLALPDGAQSWIVSSGAGVGPIGIGQSRARVETVLGLPDETRSAESYLLAFYKQFGLTIYYLVSSGQVFAISVSTGAVGGVFPTSSPEAIRDSFVSQQGVRLGDSKSSLLNVLGAPTSSSTNEAGIELLTYSGITYGIGEGKVIHLIVFNPQAAVVSLSGNWSGVWASSLVSGGGRFVFSISQVGSRITGTAALNGSPCFGAFQVVGTMSGDTFSVTLYAGGMIRATLAGRVSGITFTATYGVFSTGTPCDGDRGTVTASRF
jgi:S1-C subfamily serine protease